MTRFEAAAILNACLDRVTEKTDELDRLLEEFQSESRSTQGRIEELNHKTASLQAQQFSTTTRLNIAASMILGGIPGYKVAGISGYGYTTFNEDIMLSLNTSYTGRDLLVTRFRSGNFSEYPFAKYTNNILKMAETQAWSETLYLTQLYYSFPVGEQMKLTIGALIKNSELYWVPSAYTADILDYFSTGGASGVYSKASGEGLALQWQQPSRRGSGAWIVNLNYVVNGSCGLLSGSQNGGCGANSSYGIINQFSGINALTQIGWKSAYWGAALGYRHGTTNSTFRDGNSAAGDTLLQGQSSESLAVNLYWNPFKTGKIPSISGGYGYTFVSGIPVSDIPKQNISQSSRSWMIGLQWDKTFNTPNVAGIAVGQPPNAAGGRGSSPWLWEFFYRIQVTNNISVTPELFYGSNVSVTTSNAGFEPSGWNGWGGIIKTSFKF
jgi:hypothetical protein